jgi:predicted SAM-dependent methyltransferase
MKLNLGGMGEGFKDGSVEGFLTVDLREGADIRADCADLSFAKDGSVETIYASNILEHWSLLKTVDVLKEWRRVLRSKGKLYVSVPDFEAAVELYKAIGLTDWLRYHLWGDQKHPLNYHYNGFNFASLAKDLIDAGFSDVKRCPKWPFQVADGSQNVNTYDKKLISLNVEATA